MAQFDPSIFLRGAEDYSRQNQNLVNTFQEISAGMQRRKELEEARLERKRQEALAEQIRQQDIMRAERAAAMQPEALLAKSLRGERLTPEESSVLGAFDVLRTSQRSIDPITGEAYQKYASVSGGAPAMAAAPRAGSRELLTAGEVEPSAGSFEMLRSMGGGVEISPVTGEPLLPPPSLDASTETFKQQKMREYEPKPQPRMEMPAGLNPRQQAEFQKMMMQEEFEQRKSQREKDKDLIEKQRETENFFRGFQQDVKSIGEEVNKAIKQSSPLNTGALAGEEGKGLMGSGYLTGGKNLAATLSTIQADAAFSTLQEMRRNSPTGGALGSVSEGELALLRNSRVALEQSQNEQELDANLKKYIETRERALQNVAEAYKQDFGKYPEGYTPPQRGGNIPQGAVDKLVKNPSLAKAFNEKYGAGAAERILNGR